MRTKYTAEHDDDINCDWRAWNYPQGLERRLEDLEISGRIETLKTTAMMR